MEENRRRSKKDFEFELVDTGIFSENRYFDVFVEYAKASPDDILIRITAHNRGPEAATLHLLPTLWFRNTWSWGRDDWRPQSGARRADLAGAAVIRAEHRYYGSRWLICQEHPGIALHRERYQFPAALWRWQSHATCQGRNQRLCRPRAAQRRQSARRGHEGGSLLSRGYTAGAKRTSSLAVYRRTAQRGRAQRWFRQGVRRAHCGSE